MKLSLITMLHTKTGIETTLEFLKETRIATRKWHLERRLEELGNKLGDELGSRSGEELRSKLGDKLEDKQGDKPGEQEQRSLVGSNLLD